MTASVTNRSVPRLTTVVGGQYGSEAKGHVAAILAEHHRDSRTLHVRVGGPNAGHTVYDRRGISFAFRHLPVATVVTDCDLYLAPGSEVNLQVLLDELDLCETLGYSVRNRLMIDPQATVLTNDHIEYEVGAQYRERFGSTAKGIGKARQDRLARKAVIVQQAIDTFHKHGLRVHRPTLGNYSGALVEGTQGFGLGLHAGEYPFCTAGDCRDIDFVAQSGLRGLEEDTYVVFRTHPIRVAGNSGPMRHEITWEDLAVRTDGYVKPEKTTVTKLVRRVADWDSGLAIRALRANCPAAKPVLMFVDYLDPELAGATEFEQLTQSKAWAAVQSYEEQLECGFVLFGTGPNSHIVRPGVEL